MRQQDKKLLENTLKEVAELIKKKHQERINQLKETQQKVNNDSKEGSND